MLPRRGNLNNIATRISPFPYTHIFPLNLKTMGSERVSEGERERAGASPLLSRRENMFSQISDTASS